MNRARHDRSPTATTTGPAGRLRALLEHNRTLHEAEQRDTTHLARLRALQDWQSQRLQATHADLAAEPRYAPGVDFFVNDLYAPKDFAGRDADVETAYPYMVRLLPRKVLDTAGDAMQLYVLSRRLDADMATALFDTLGVEAIDEDAYAEAYRVCDDHTSRAQQIDLVEHLARRLDRYVRSSLLYATLKMARGPARAAGLRALQDFLERGFGAFHHMRGSEHFVATITSRERAILERIFERHPAPFDLTR